MSQLLEHLALAGGVGAASHLGANALYGGARALSNWSPKRAIVQRLISPVQRLIHGMEQRALAKGIRQGVEGKPRGAGQRLIETLAGPESYAAQEQGRLLGSALRNKGGDFERRRALSALNNALADLQTANPAMAKQPTLVTLRGGVQRALEGGRLPKVGPVRPESRVTRATPYLATLGLGAVDPPAAIHGIINTIRSKLPGTSIGKKFFQQDAREGVARALPGFKAPLTSRARWLATDTLVSPMARDLGKVNEALAVSARTHPAETSKVLNALRDLTPGTTPKRLDPRGLLESADTELSKVPGYAEWRTQTFKKSS